MHLAPTTVDRCSPPKCYAVSFLCKISIRRGEHLHLRKRSTAMTCKLLPASTGTPMGARWFRSRVFSVSLRQNYIFKTITNLFLKKEPPPILFSVKSVRCKTRTALAAAPLGVRVHNVHRNNIRVSKKTRTAQKQKPKSKLQHCPVATQSDSTRMESLGVPSDPDSHPFTYSRAPLRVWSSDDNWAEFWWGNPVAASAAETKMWSFLQS